MDNERYPNVFYVGRSVSGWFFEQIQLGLWNLANVRTFWVPEGRLDRVRGRFAKGFQTVRKPTAQRKLLYRLSNLAQKFGKAYSLAGLGNASMEPDVIFVADVFRKIEGLSEFSCPKAYYVQDPHISLKRYFDLGHIEDYDHVFVTQKNSVDDLKAYGIRKVTWLPWACDHDVFFGPETVRDISVSFFGTVNPMSPRAPLVSMLETKFGLVRRPLYLREMAATLRKSKIVFNRSLTGDLNQRNFEVMGAGALLVTDRIENGLFDLFQEKVHLVTYEGQKELEERITYYLQHSDEREAVAYAGQNEVLAKHTYLHRAAKILDVTLGVDLMPTVEGKLRHLQTSLSPPRRGEFLRQH